ncbi:MAG: tetratricopeptide repeat protein [Candidatus Acidiferrum sp.]
MPARFSMHFRIALISFCGLLLPVEAWAGKPAQSPQQGALANPNNGNEALYVQADVDVYLQGPNGEPLAGSAVVTVFKLNGQYFDQKTAKDGYVRFNNLPPTEYTFQVVAPRYQRASKQLELNKNSGFKITIEMKPLSEVENAASSESIFALVPKAQREVGKALEALRANKSNGARGHLEAARKASPTSAEVEYLFGVYASQINDQTQANTHWMKALELDPKHLSALLAVSFDLLHENKPVDAVPYLKRAVETEPSSWRAHALFAEALVLQNQRDDAIKEAERAIELGHERAASVQLILVRALAGRGDKDEAIKVLEAYAQAHPKDTAAGKDLDRLKNPQPGDASSDAAAAATEMAAVTKDATALPMPSSWLPPNVDDKVPPVEAGASCAVDDVVANTGKQLMELVKDVDRFAAIESLTHESVNKNGLVSPPEKRKFNYVVSIEEVRHGYLSVEEYRNSGGSPAQFPDGVATNGLPALVLIFHPYNAINFEMTCEGLARSNGGLAWQVHFKQRTDKPNTIKRYRIGAEGPSYPVALKGRAWISADNFQILRLETDLVSPVPQLKLLADHADIEYGPVKFAKGNVSMWLPKSADAYYDWKGRRIHRRHSFSNYLLFAVDDKQKITVPKVDEAPAIGGPSASAAQEP